MSLMAVAPDEYVFWTLTAGRRGKVRFDVDSSVGVSTYIFGREDWDEDADFEALPFYARTRRRMEHAHKFWVEPGIRLVAVVWNRSQETAAVDAHVLTS